MQDGQRTPERIAQDMRAAGLPDKYIQNNFAVMDKDRHREISSRGGIKSGEARRNKAEQQQRARAMLNAVMFAGYTEQDIEDFRKWQRHRKYLQKKKAAKG